MNGFFQFNTAIPMFRYAAKAAQSRYGIFMYAAAGRIL